MSLFQHTQEQKGENPSFSASEAPVSTDSNQVNLLLDPSKFLLGSFWHGTWKLTGTPDSSARENKDGGSCWKTTNINQKLRLRPLDVLCQHVLCQIVIFMKFCFFAIMISLSVQKMILTIDAFFIGLNLNFQWSQSDQLEEGKNRKIAVIFVWDSFNN